MLPSHNRSILRPLAPFFFLTLTLGLLSDGVYHDDDLTHFLMARWARWFPSYLLHIWGRPGLTAPLAAVSWIGDSSTAWHAARILSALATAAAAFIAARLAIRLRAAAPALVVLACALQPLNSVLACTTLTENFTALYLISAVALLHAHRPLLASSIFSIALLTRHEAVIFLPLWWLALLAAQIKPRARASDDPGDPLTLSRVATAVTLSLWAPIVHNVLFRIVFEEWPVRVYFQARGSTEFLPTGPLAYVPDALYALTPAIAALACVGGLVLIRRRQPLIPAMVTLFFITQAAIKALGLFASGGYGRFMVAVAPLTAILAAAGWTELRSSWNGSGELRKRRALLLSAAVWGIALAANEVESRAGRLSINGSTWLTVVRIAAVAIISLHMAAYSVRMKWVPRVAMAAIVATAIIQCVAMVRPLRIPEAARQAREVVDWLHAEHLDGGPIFATDPWFSYYLDLVEDPRAYKGPTLLASMPVGTVFIWDSTYSASDYHRLKLDDYRNDPHYTLLKIFRSGGHREMFVFKKNAATPLPPVAEHPFPPPMTGRRAPVLGSYYIRPSAR